LVRALERGWTSFESGVATEALARAYFFRGLHAALKPLPPKLYEIDGDEPEPLTKVGGGGEGAGPRIERVRASINAAFFTGRADKPMVVWLYNDYITSISNAMVLSGEVQEATYEGEYNAAGQREGRGTVRYADGEVYEGEWKADKMEGHGTYRAAHGDVYEGEWKADKMEGRSTMRYADGDVYEGEYKANKKEGRGTYRFANGRAMVSRLKADAPVGKGTAWSADRQTAWRMRDGKRREEITLEEAARIAQRLASALGLPVP
jgi:hypothetical protein